MIAEDLDPYSLRCCMAIRTVFELLKKRKKKDKDKGQLLFLNWSTHIINSGQYSVMHVMRNEKVLSLPSRFWARLSVWREGADFTAATSWRKLSCLSLDFSRRRQSLHRSSERGGGRERSQSWSWNHSGLHQICPRPRQGGNHGPLSFSYPPAWSVSEESGSLGDTQTSSCLPGWDFSGSYLNLKVDHMLSTALVRLGLHIQSKCQIRGGEIIMIKSKGATNLSCIVSTVRAVVLQLPWVTNHMVQMYVLI